MKKNNFFTNLYVVCRSVATPTHRFVQYEILFLDYHDVAQYLHSHDRGGIVAWSVSMICAHAIALLLATATFERFIRRLLMSVKNRSSSTRLIYLSDKIISDKSIYVLTKDCSDFYRFLFNSREK